MKTRLLEVVLAIAGLVAVSTANADGVRRLPLIAALQGSNPQLAAHHVRAFHEGLREHGYVDGQNVTIEWRWAQGKLERLPALAAELVALKPDVIFAPPTPSAIAALKATNEIPIVFALAADPVGNGLVKSLAKPGGNVTGMSTINVELGAKRLEILKDAFPAVRRVAVLHNPADTSNTLQLSVAQDAARTLKVEVVPIGVQRREDFDRAFAEMKRARVDGLMVLENPTNFTNRKHVVELVNKAGWPTMYALEEFVDAGGLMAYTVNYPDQFRRAAGYVARILKGEKPADLPVEQPTRVSLIVSLKAARATGKLVPEHILVRADEVIR
jgi:putative ABC transport system substrate-binding protein